MDNLIQIAHNVVVGQHCLIAAQSGVAGSTELGNFVMIGGQVGIAQHLKIADGVQVAAKSGVMSDVMEKGAKIGGVPAMPLRQFHRSTVALRKLTLERNGLPKES
mmetsp:Transcript_5370/g.9654  ORF Transcript_5370/g.9654 Transcript_5370/m.9654 type:complete len:105 (+) Transcript_5370:68-382(+)